jgi:signal recognition particle receptor subunit beta
MVQFNFARREVSCKLVYYGPGMSGKTTNIELIHQQAPQNMKGQLTSIATEGDRTLFFDFLPLDLGEIAGMRTKFQLYTVPGQVYYNSTRKLVLQGADGVAFIADSQISETEHNAASFLDLRQNLKDLGLSPKSLPLVIQFNKRDLDRIRSDEEITALAGRGREPVFKGSAVHGQGVLETFFGLLHLTWSKLDAEHQLAKMMGVETRALLPMAARQMGITAEVSTLLAACVGGNLDRKGAS